MSETYAALLRGINVGGNNKLPMKDLAAMFTAAGCRDVSTYIQSGNVVFSAGAALVATLPATMSESIFARFGFRVPVVVRSARELAGALAANPFLASGVGPDALHVAFLADLPSAAQLVSLDPQRSPGDAFAVLGREVYLHLPNGVARSKLTNAWLDARLLTTSTVRNWRTVQKLVEMTGG
jgi:uncharacterized protein (DUF1697 family)